MGRQAHPCLPPPQRLHRRLPGGIADRHHHLPARPVEHPLLNREKGYFAMAYLLSLSAAVAVQKNGRDVARATPADVPGT